MAKKNDVVVEATYARNLLGKVRRMEEPSDEVLKAAELLAEALAVVQERRKSLADAMGVK